MGSTLAGTTAASYGSFFQWGRNVPFPSIGNVPTIAGPLSLVAANATTKFITGNPDNNLADWQTPSDNGAWGDII